MGYKEKYNIWLESVTDEELLNELRGMDDVQAEDAFYRDLEFGTGGLRGVLGAGTNRMNIYTVAKATQGLANYVNDNYEDPSVAVAYDSRIKSDLFSKVAATVLANNGVKVHLYPQLMPTPCLSFAVRRLGCSAGIIVTASHNPSKYNGYKVYGADGCQITTDQAEAIYNEIEKLDPFKDVKTGTFNEALESGLIEYIDQGVFDDFTKEVLGQSVLFGEEIDRDVAIVYTPLNGAGLVPVTRALSEAGFTNITVVEEQRLPDGNFPTCPYPNPEIREAMELGLKYCKNIGADLLIATDPDSDRCGIAVKDGDDYRLITGNETGILLLDYICSQRSKHGKMPEHPVFIKTIVTMDLGERIAAHYGVETINVLTGFKYIGEQIGRMEAIGQESNYICGFEESYGYLTGTYVRDKDAVNAALMIAEMFAYYKTHGVSLLDKINEIYSDYGYCRNTLYSIQLEGSAGMQKMADIMAAMRAELKTADNTDTAGISTIGDLRITEIQDYSLGINDLPKADVLKYILEEGCSVVIRPSGTEPKLKIYISVTAKDEAQAISIESKIRESIGRYTV